ncbi:unnamed protein product [Ilex paraguariensis]|uniref:Uncharacterized protein n=1 Tax=Ilex paraguariensis TaxID=185542 RepID=A0ABC8TD27_9AQUA
MKSGYRLIKEKTLHVYKGKDNVMSSGKWRDFLWNLKISCKIKHFALRLFQDILPTQCNLHRKHLLVCDGCFLCENPQETMMHLFLECPYSIKAGGFGVIIRNCNGSFVFGLCHFAKGFSTANHIEALSASKVLGFAMEMGYSNIIVEGDSKNIIEAIGKMKRNLSNVEPFIDLIQEYAKDFYKISFSWICNSGNETTHVFI